MNYLHHAVSIVAVAFVVVLSISEPVAADPSDWQSRVFHSCCVRAKMSCPEMCEYPPPVPGFWQKICLTSSWNEYLNCYTQEKNNTECCVAAGVTGDVAICQDMCHGGHVGEKPSMGHGNCGGDVGMKITKCNKDAIVPEGGEGPADGVKNSTAA